MTGPGRRPDPRDTDPLRVDPPHPVIRCSRCGDPLPFGRIGRCDDCTGRGGNPIGCLVLAILAVLALAVLVGSSIAAPRSAQTTLSVDVSGQRSAEPTGAPRPQAESRRAVGGESTLVAGASTGISLPPARSSALDAPGRLAREGTPAQPTGQTAVSASPSGAGGIPRPGPEPFRGLATWCAPTPAHCRGWDKQFVGAVPSFRWGDEPYAVQVCLADEPATCTHVVVTSHCACGDRRGQPTVIDLSVPAFRELAPLRRGVIAVIVSGPIDVPVGPTLPPTSIEEKP